MVTFITRRRLLRASLILGSSAMSGVLSQACTSATPAVSSTSGAVQPGSVAPTRAVTTSAPSATQQAPTPLTPPVTLRMSDGGITGNAGTYIALDRGYFKDEGIDLQLVPFNGSASDVLAALTGGGANTFDLGGTAPSAALFNAAARGVGAKSVLAVEMISPTAKANAILVRQDHLDSGRWKSPADFKGMKISILSVGGTSHYFVELALKQGGLTDKDVEIVPLSFGDAVVALANKSIDAAHSVEPFITQSEQAGSAKSAMLPGELASGFPNTIHLAGPTTLQTFAEPLKRYATAVLRGNRDYYTAITLNRGGRQQVIETLIAHTAIKDAAQYDRLNPAQMTLNGTVNMDLMNGLQDFFVQAGQQQQKISPDQVFDSSFADYAVGRLGPATT